MPKSNSGIAKIYLILALVVGYSSILIQCQELAKDAKDIQPQNTSASDIDIVEGVRLSVGDGRSDDLLKLNINLSKVKDVFEGRRGKDKKLLQRILPMFIIPFLIQSAIVPMFLSTLKMMLVKSMMVGKLALILIAINALRTSNAFKSRGEERLADLHYGYHGSGMEEYGAYVNKRGF